MTRWLPLLAIVAGCSGGDDWAERIRPALEAADARASAVNVPAATGLEAPRRTSSPRLYLAAGSAVLDLAPATPPSFEADVPESTRREYLPGPPLSFGAIRGDSLELPGTLDDDGHPTGERLGSVLENARLRRSDLRHVAVFAERGLPARVLAQALSVLSVLGTVDAELRFAGPAGPVGAMVSLPPPTDATDVVGPSRSAPPADDEIQLELARVDGGFALTTLGGHVLPDCRNVSFDPQITVPDQDEAPSAASLTRCLHTIDATFPLTTIDLRADGMSVDELPLILGSVREAAAGTVRVILRPGPRPSPPAPASALEILENTADLYGTGAMAVGS